MSNVHTTNGTGKSRRAVNGKAVPHVVAGQGSRPDKALIGICVIDQKGSPFIRIALRAHHLKSIGNPERVDIRGSTRDGLMVAPGKQYKAYNVGNGSDLYYITFSLRNFEARLSPDPRAQIWMRPEVKGGHLQLPGCPEAWIKAEGEYQRGVWHEKPPIFEGGHKLARLSPFAGDDAATVHQDAKRVNPPAPPAPPAAPPAPVAPVASTQGVTAPLPKAPVPNYQVPTDIREIEHQLAGKVGEVRALLQAMQDKTGLQFTLDRNLRVALVLREKPDK